MDLSLGVERPWSENDQSCPPSTDIKNVWTVSTFSIGLGSVLLDFIAVTILSL